MAGTAGGAPGWAMTPEQHQEQLMQQQLMQPPTSTAQVVTPPVSGGVPHPRVLHKNNRIANMEDKVLITRTANEETEDGRIRNKEAMSKIRDAWVYKQVRERVDEFTEYKQVSSKEEIPIFLKNCAFLVPAR
jgi:hypothetical protein